MRYKFFNQISLKNIKFHENKSKTNKISHLNRICIYMCIYIYIYKYLYLHICIFILGQIYIYVYLYTYNKYACVPNKYLRF